MDGSRRKPFQFGLISLFGLFSLMGVLMVLPKLVSLFWREIIWKSHRGSSERYAAEIVLVISFVAVFLAGAAVGAMLRGRRNP